MKFNAAWYCYTNSYGAGLIGFGSLLLFMLIRPLSAGQGFRFFEMFSGVFLTDARLSGLFLGLCIFWQIVFYLSSGKFLKILDVSEDGVNLHLFSGKIFEFKYSDLASANLVFDTWL